MTRVRAIPSLRYSKQASALLTPYEPQCLRQGVLVARTSNQIKNTYFRRCF